MTEIIPPNTNNGDNQLVAGGALDQAVARQCLKEVHQDRAAFNTPNLGSSGDQAAQSPQAVDNGQLKVTPISDVIKQSQASDVYQTAGTSADRPLSRESYDALNPTERHELKSWLIQKGTPGKDPAEAPEGTPVRNIEDHIDTRDKAIKALGWAGTYDSDTPAAATASTKPEDAQSLSQQSYDKLTREQKVDFKSWLTKMNEGEKPTEAPEGSPLRPIQDTIHNPNDAYKALGQVGNYDHQLAFPTQAPPSPENPTTDKPKPPAPETGTGTPSPQDSGGTSHPDHMTMEQIQDWFKEHGQHEAVPTTDSGKIKYTPASASGAAMKPGEISEEDYGRLTIHERSILAVYLMKKSGHPEVPAPEGTALRKDEDAEALYDKPPEGTLLSKLENNIHTPQQAERAWAAIDDYDLDISADWAAQSHRE